MLHLRWNNLEMMKNTRSHMLIHALQINHKIEFFICVSSIFRIGSENAVRRNELHRTVCSIKFNVIVQLCRSNSWLQKISFGLRSHFIYVCHGLKEIIISIGTMFHIYGCLFIMHNIKYTGTFSRRTSS